MASAPDRARVRLTMNERLRAQRRLPSSTIEGIIAAQTERAILIEWPGYRQWFPKVGVSWVTLDSARIIYNEIVRVGPGTPYLDTRFLDGGSAPLVRPQSKQSLPYALEDIPSMKTAAWRHQIEAYGFVCQLWGPLDADI